jgi:hypothetical protein
MRSSQTGSVLAVTVLVIIGAMLRLLLFVATVAINVLAQRSVLLESSASSVSWNPATHRESKIVYQVAVATVSEWTDEMMVCIWTEYLALDAITSASPAGFTRSIYSCTVQPSGIYVFDSTRHGIYQIKAAVVLSHTADFSDPVLLSDVAALQFQVDCSRVQILQVPVGSALLRMGDEVSTCDDQRSTENTSSWKGGVAASTAIAHTQVRNLCRLFSSLCCLTNLT